MKKYETPELTFESLNAQDVISDGYAEGGDNETDWLLGWASAINNVKN